MLLDARELPPDIRLSADVAIVGAGPAGITIAHELKDAGLSILLVDAGGPAGGDDGDSDFLSGEVVDPARHPPLDLYRTRGLGGTSALWGGRCVPLDPTDFAPRAHVPWSGWPISYEDVGSWYGRALEYCEAGPFRFRVQEALGPHASPMVPGFAAEDVAVDGIERFSPPTHFGRRYGSALVAAGAVTVILAAACTGIEPSPSGGAVLFLRMASAPDRRFTIRARQFVLACGGLETPRLLLASDVGTRSGMVGRFYMCHIEGKGAVARFPPGRRIAFGYERDAYGVYFRRYFSLPAAVQDRLRITNVALRFEPPPLADPSHRNPVLSAMHLAHGLFREEYRRRLAGRGYRGDQPEASRYGLARHAANVALGLPQLAAFAGDWTARHWLARRKLPYIAARARDGSLALDFNAEQTPQPSSRVVLADGKDRFGTPRIKVDWHVGALDVESVVTAYRLLAARLEAAAAGVLEVDEEAVRLGFEAMGGHHIGTTRMAEDESRGVVDGNCRVFGMDNLFIAGSSVFATCGHANPTLTLVALSLRLAEHLKALTRPTVAQRRLAPSG